MENKNADPSNNNIVRNWLSGIGAALVVIVAVTYAIHRKDTISPVISMNEATSTDQTVGTTPSSTSARMAQNEPAGTMTTASMGEMVMVDDQPAGDSVTVSEMSLARRSWIAVKDSNGSILGAGLFPADATSGTVPLLRATVAGEHYEVVVYVDDGDHIFDFHKDMLVTSANGSPVSTAFSAK